MARFIAFYLPQFHPTPENNEWWGPGFTEWHSVAKARPLFRGHKQPHLPGELGFYDLRLPETREAQAELAREAGIEAFCYWHYWFGNGKRLLERPFSEVLVSGKPDFPFCLAWANHSWYKKLWDPKAKNKDILLMEQTYPGVEDYEAHFYAMLPAFQDKRYFRVNGKPLFIIYDTQKFDDIRTFVSTWRKLAKENGLNDFYFVGTDFDGRFYEDIMKKGLDAVYENDSINIHHNLSKLEKGLLYFHRMFLNRPTVFEYKKAIKYMITPLCKVNNVLPMITPNWDHSPRSGGRAIILNNSTPELFKKLVSQALDTVKDKPKDEQIIVIKSWNEWGEGNYIEPDTEFGHGYLDALRDAINEHSH